MATEWYRCWFDQRQTQLLVVFEEQQQQGYWRRYDCQACSGSFQSQRQRPLVGRRTIHEEYEILSLAPVGKSSADQLYAGSAHQWLEITQRQISAQQSDNEITAKWYRGHRRHQQMLSGECLLQVSYRNF